jgi:DNA-binding NarL/FixJ family response regulator
MLLLCDRTAPPAPRGAAPILTDREQQVLAAIARGRTNQEVAAELSIMPTT